MKTKHLKIFSAIVLIAMIVTVFSSCMGTGTANIKAKDANGTYEGFKWTFEADDFTLTITGTGAMKNFENVDSVAWKEVRGTAKKLVISEGVTTVADYAFSFFTVLEEIKLPSTVTKIGKSAFEGCTALKSAEIPETVTSVGERTFFACKTIESITFKGNVTVETLGKDAIKTCPSLKAIYAPISSVAVIKAAVDAKTVNKEFAVKEYDPNATITPPAEEDTTNSETDGESESESDTEKSDGTKKPDIGGIIAIIVMAVIIVAGVVVVIIYVRKEKKAPKNTTTVVKKDKGDKKDKKNKKK